jgi:transposase-like protein
MRPQWKPSSARKALRAAQQPVLFGRKAPSPPKTVPGSKIMRLRANGRASAELLAGNHFRHSGFRRRGRTGLARSMGHTLPVAGLPPPNTERWVARRKAAVVDAVSSGVITLEEACRRYQMSEEEFFAWRRAFETYGVNGLHVTLSRRNARRPRTANPASPGANSMQPGSNSASKRTGPRK